MEELTFSWPKEFYLFLPGRSGFSDGEANYQIASHKPRASMLQRLSDLAHRYCIKEDSTVARFFQALLTFQGNGYGVFTYLRGYKFDVKSSQALDDEITSS